MDADICIIGAGPAGLALASSLIGSGLTVILVEAGSSAAETDRLPPVSLGADDPYPNGDVSMSHASMVGGTAGLWSFHVVAEGDEEPVSLHGCRYLPLQPLDYQARDEVGTPGWPIGPEDLQPGYERAQAVCGLGPFRYDAERWADPQAKPLPLDGTGVVTSMFQFGPDTAFTHDIRAELEKASNVALLTDTAAVRLEYPLDSDRIDGVWVATATGRRLITSQTVVLAAGGLETVRLLLDTGRVSGRVPGNRSDLVGRYFTEHPLVRGGLLVTDASSQMIQRLALYATRRVDGTYVSAKLTLSDDVVAAEGLLACSMLLVPRDLAYGKPGSQALARLRSPSGKRDLRSVRLRNLIQVLAGAPSVVRAARARGSQPSIDDASWTGDAADPRYSVFEMLHQTEQSPDPNNRLTLTGDVDELGRSGLLLTWRWSEEDQKRIARSRDLFAQAFRQRGIGTVVNTDWDGGRPRFLGGTHHHLGTTRMSDDPNLGVVDSDCRVHGTDNLYIASGTVFPSAGFVNPTLTVCALALRLGDHIAQSAKR